MSLIESTTLEKYGITERKKAEIDALTNEVLYAQSEVEQLQAIVDSLTEKSGALQTQLSTDETNKKATLTNQESLEEVIDNVIDVLLNSKITFVGIKKSDKKIREVAISVENVTNKLIYSAEVVNKLSNLVIRKKAQNPLISDELVTMVNTVGTDANNAVALALTALNSVIASQTTTVESEGVMTLEFLQAIRLYEFITGNNLEHEKNKDIEAFIEELYKQKKLTINKEGSLEALIKEACVLASERYDNTLKASKKAQKQLGEAQNRLSKETVKLNSLEAGLAAANAAALAS